MYWCLTSFFPIVDTCLSCEDIARQSCAIVPRWRIFGDFVGLAFPASRVQHISDLFRSMVDIQSATADISEKKRKKEKKKERYHKAKI